MSWTTCENFNPDIPDTRILLYNSLDLNPVLLEELGLFRTIIRESNHVLVTDTTIAKLHLDDLTGCLNSLSIQFNIYMVKPGEEAKTITTYADLLSHCAQYSLDKKSTIIGFGGGVVKDIAGFLASTLFRGVNLVQIPTTVLNQVDAAIDWKQALNLPHGKNLIGSMYSPSEVWVNPAFARTLDERYLKDGLSESIKIALCRSAPFLHTLLQARIHDPDWLASVINESAALKAETMKRDSEPDDGVKQYGHAVGHAVEHLAQGKYGHGEAIAIGMCVTAEVALLAGFCGEETVKAHYDAFEKYGLPTRVPDWLTAEAAWDQINFDKYFLHGKMYSMVLRGVGEAVEDGEGRAMLPFDRDIVIQATERNRKR